MTDQLAAARVEVNRLSARVCDGGLDDEKGVTEGAHKSNLVEGALRLQEYMHRAYPPLVVDEVLARLKIDVQARRAILQPDAWADAVEAALLVVEQGGELEERHRLILDAAIAQDTANGPGPMARDLMELLVQVAMRSPDRYVDPRAN